jgi:YidC/Oxa1 family membrane protein insertase
MNPPEEKSSFFDRSTVLAILLVLTFWMAWSKYVEWKYPPAPVAKTLASPSPAPGTASALSNIAAKSNQINLVTPPSVDVGSDAGASEKVFEYADKNWAFQISSHGMGLRSIDVKSYQTREGTPILLAPLNDTSAFATLALDTHKPLEFDIKQVDAVTYIGRATVDGATVEKTLKILPELFSVDTTIKATNAQALKGLVTSLNDTLNEGEPAGLMNRSADFQSWFLLHDNEKTRKPIHRKDGLILEQANVSVAALSSHYFAMGLVDKSTLLPRFTSSVPAQSDRTPGELVYQVITPAPEFDIIYRAFAGPKSFDLLSNVDENLAQVIDYGTFAVLAKPMLNLLRWLYTVIGNWGWAIIALTIIVRLIVLPANVYSYRSMKVMQKLQPEMNKVRERYKDKPADQKLQMNQEIMELMKTNKASPLGGCLPMLLQLPVFIALYQVLGQSIELYRAPFMFWIHDLSAKDPYFVLPVLMGITMFVNQKMTPTGMDPQQAKIMMIMPVVFSFFMISLPSGLTLYIFVSTLFGIVQQYLFVRDRTTSVKVAQA